MRHIDFYWNIFKDLFPITRSLTGIGNRQTLDILRKNDFELEIKSVECGKKVFDWEVPPEWNFNSAYIKNKYGKKIVSSEETNLCVVNFSCPVSGMFSKEELLKNIHTLESLPEAYPYRTTYYERNWGFCIPYEVIKSKDFVGPFEVRIDCELNPNGKLIYGELFLPGKLEKEILISTYFCHPSMANDNLSGVISTLMIIDYLKSLKNLEYSYRIIFIPETIGAICFLHNNKESLDRFIGGMIVSNTAGRDKLSFKNSFDQNHWINRLARHAVKEVTRNDFIEYPFSPDGSDERQYSTPGVRINTPSFHRSKYHEFKEYHTSLDDMNFVSKAALQESFDCFRTFIDNIETNVKPVLVNPVGEPFLSKRNLYPTTGVLKQPASINTNKFSELDLDLFFKIWHHLDGQNTLVDIADCLDLNFAEVKQIVDVLLRENLCTLG